MDPWERRRRIFRDLFDDEFDFGFDFENSFAKMEEQMAKAFSDAMKNIDNPQQEGSPYVYGFSMKVGPDGQPHIEEFGNTKKPAITQEGVEGGREPLTDIINSEKDITVIAEIPGIEKKDIDLTINPQELKIKVEAEKRKYYKKISLPEKIDEDSVKANYNNGILEVKLPKKKPEKPKTKKVKIE